VAGEYIIEVAALRFGGESGRATIDFVEPLALGESFTLEVWLRPDVLQGTVAVLGVYFEEVTAAGSPAIRPLLLWFDNGKPMFSIAADRSNAQPVNLTLTQEWCHIAIVRNRAQLGVRLRPGQREPSAFQLNGWGARGLALKELILGSAEEAGSSVPSFNGAFAELRLWNTARTNQDIDNNRSQQLVGNEAGLVAYWMLDEGSGNILLDSSVNNNQGLVTGGAWELASRLQLTISSPDAQTAFLKDTKLPALKKIYDQTQRKEKDLAPVVRQLEKEQQQETAQYRQKETENKVTLNQEEQALATRRVEIEKAKAEKLQTLTATRQITLANFIERLQDKLARSRAGLVGEHGRNVQGLDSVAMEVKMVPGYGGEGLQLPQPGMRTEPGRLSTLTLRLAARPGIEKVEPKLAPAPELEGTTEIYARRVLGAAGFRVEVIYQAAERVEQHGRVLKLLYSEKEPGKAALDSIITLVIGQRG